MNILSTFTFEFNDQESDRTIIIVTHNDIVDTYVQQDPANKSKVKLLLQSSIFSEDATELFCYYTDTYHQNSQYYKSINISISVFEVDPPYFENDPQIFHADRWSDFVFEFPNVIEPNNLTYSFFFYSVLPDWITINSKYSLNLNTKNLSYNISEITTLYMKIINEYKSWRNYSLTIETDKYSAPSFGFISNIYVPANSITDIKVNVQGVNLVKAVNWESNILVLWVSFLDSNNIMRINSENIDNLVEWIMLSSTDSWGNSVYSNKVFITFTHEIPKPPSVWSNFGPLKVYTGDKALFLIPSDLFISEDSSNLNYSVSVLGWSANSSLTTSVNEYYFDRNHYLYIFSSQAKQWKLSLKVEDTYSQSAETIINVIVVNCASKDWEIWNSEYQSGWTKWKYRYKLDSTGSWYLDNSYFPQSVNGLYDIWGIIILTWLIAQVILSFILGVKALHPIEFSQTFIIFIWSLIQQDQNLDRFISWIQFFKLDFGFLDVLHLRNVFHWSNDLERMERIQFYWNSTVMNYFYLISIALLSIVTLIILRKLSVKIQMINKIYLFLRKHINTSNISWIMIHL